MTTLECFFDCASPWGYLGFHNIQNLIRRIGMPITWRPVVVGGVFNKVNQGIYENRANPNIVKRNWARKDMQDWAAVAGIVINNPPACGHPTNTVKIMRACLHLQETQSDAAMLAFARAAYEHLWRDGRNLGHEDVFRSIAASVGQDPDQLWATVGDSELGLRLRDNSEELMDRGGFGVPTFFVNRTDMHFGNDRLPLVERAIQLSRDAEAQAAGAALAKARLAKAHTGG